MSQRPSCHMYIPTTLGAEVKLHNVAIWRLEGCHVVGHAHLHESIHDWPGQLPLQAMQVALGDIHFQAHAPCNAGGCL